MTRCCLLGDCSAGTPRGEELVQCLAALGVKETGLPPADHSDAYAMEVFPLPALFRLFDRVPRYKRKKKRTWEQCRAGLSDLIELLGTLRERQLILPAPLVLRDEKGVALKRIEDRVDAVFCGYVAAVAWLDSARVEIVGTLQTGYIVLPTPPLESEPALCEHPRAPDRLGVFTSLMCHAGCHANDPATRSATRKLTVSDLP